MSTDATNTCQHEGCTNPGNPCWLPDSDYDGEPDYWYCGEHAHDECFCPGCGMFWGGVESFDFRLNGTDYCDNCAVEFDDDDDYDDDLDFGWEYPMYEDLLADETGGRWVGPGSDIEATEHDDE